LYQDRKFPTQWYISEVFEKDIETGHEHTLNEYRNKKDPGGRAVFVPAEYRPALDTNDAEYPMIATSGRQAYHWHTRTKTGRAPDLHEAAPGVFVSLNERDARNLNIDDGDTVRVTSRRGSVVAPAKIGTIVGPGVVFIPFHYGELGENHAANNVMPKTWDPVSKQPVQKFAAVRVERVRSSEEAPWWQKPL
jgi:anaerobic selenocysteine-containing dehydrogenase